MIKEITIIGGAGHVGLAFALICTSKNIKVHIHDTNKKSINLIKKGVMPHKEKNGSKFLKEAINKNLFSYSSKIEDIKMNKINKTIGAVCGYQLPELHEKNNKNYR